MAHRVQNLAVMELCEGGSLHHALQRDTGIRRPREFGWSALRFQEIPLLASSLR